MRKRITAAQGLLARRGGTAGSAWVLGDPDQLTLTLSRMRVRMPGHSEVLVRIEAGAICAPIWTALPLGKGAARRLSRTTRPGVNTWARCGA